MASFIDMSDGELDELVRTVFKIKNFESRCIDEATNGTLRRYAGIDGVLSENDKKIIAKWEAGKGTDNDWGSVRVMLNALAFHDLIQKGDYLIEYSW